MYSNIKSTNYTYIYIDAYRLLYTVGQLIIVSIFFRLSKIYVVFGFFTQLMIK